jgi:hypothetical protein
MFLRVMPEHDPCEDRVRLREWQWGGRRYELRQAWEERDEASAEWRRGNPHIYDCVTSLTGLFRGLKSSAFGAVALFGVIYYASGIPRVQQDILMKIPFLDKYFVKEVNPADNVSSSAAGRMTFAC